MVLVPDKSELLMEVKPKPSFEFKQNMKNVTKMAPERKGGSIEWLHFCNWIVSK